MPVFTIFDIKALSSSQILSLLCTERLNNLKQYSKIGNIILVRHIEFYL